MPATKKTTKKATKKAIKKEFHVYVNEEFVRTYSVDDHGKDAGKLAEMFAQKQREVFKKEVEIK